MKILIGICGSVSAYRLLDLTRELSKSGHQVRVVLTKGAQKFVVPEVFGYLGAQRVYRADDDFNHRSILHIELARWCDKLVIAPLSANTLARLARGEAADLLGSVFLAMEQDKPILVFPAMNSKMFGHPFVRDNFARLEKLASLPQLVVHPTDTGMMACAEVGPGKLATVPTMLTWIECFEYHPGPPKKTALITTGATLAPLDPVRYLTNPASGRTGFYLARQFLRQGYVVHVIAGQKACAELDLPLGLPRYHLQRVATVGRMKAAVERLWPVCDVCICAAAVGDIEFARRQEKINKEELGDSLPIVPTQDILQFVLQSKRAGQKVVGFAAQTDLASDKLRRKWQAKPVDLLVGTQVDSGLVGNASLAGFHRSSAGYALYDGHRLRPLGELHKSELARVIAKEVDDA